MLSALIPQFRTHETEAVFEFEDGERCEGMLRVKYFAWLCFSYTYRAEVEWKE